jgi:hypothetical protein
MIPRGTAFGSPVPSKVRGNRVNRRVSFETLIAGYGESQAGACLYKSYLLSLLASFLPLFVNLCAFLPYINLDSALPCWRLPLPRDR